MKTGDTIQYSKENIAANPKLAGQRFEVLDVFEVKGEEKFVARHTTLICAYTSEFEVVG